MAHCISHTQCPKCAENGKDKHANNLGNYDDGSLYCFSCGYFSSRQRLSKIKSTIPTNTRRLSLPEDTTFVLEKSGIEYLRKYSITSQEQRQYNILWSPYTQRIIFPLFNNNELLGWQGRYLGNNPTKPKWFSQGDLKSILCILGNKQTQQVILTEDIISSIVLSRSLNYCASPLFGSHLSIKRLQRFTILSYNKFLLWLDKDKEKESIKFAYQARQLGYNCISIITNKDPKEYSQEEIKNILTERNMCVTLN